MSGGAAWLDAGLGSALVLAAVVGLRRGPLAEMLALPGTLGAFLAAAWLTPQSAPWVPIGVNGSPLNFAATLLLLVVALQSGWWLLTRLPLMVAKPRAAGFVDRALAAALGVCRGWILLLGLATVVSLTPAAQSSVWQKAYLARALSGAVNGLVPLLPPEVGRALRAATRN